MDLLESSFFFSQKLGRPLGEIDLVLNILPLASLEAEECSIGFILESMNSGGVDIGGSSWVRFTFISRHTVCFRIMIFALLIERDTGLVLPGPDGMFAMSALP